MASKNPSKSSTIAITSRFVASPNISSACRKSVLYIHTFHASDLLQSILYAGTQNPAVSPPTLPIFPAFFPDGWAPLCPLAAHRFFYTTAQDWTAKGKKSLLATYFLLVSILTAIGFYISGMLNDRVMILFGYSVIPLIMGTYLGIITFNRIVGTYQNNIINIFVLGLGITLLLKLILHP